MTAVLISYASPVDDEAEPSWLAWYHGTHIVEMRGILPEITSIEQYRLFRPGSPRPRFVTIYRTESLNAAEVATRLREGASRFSPSLSQPTGEDASAFQIADVA